jgi:hypothetical protein
MLLSFQKAAASQEQEQLEKHEQEQLEKTLLF